MKNKGLVLLTSGFPLDTNEPFLVPEFKEFSKVFDQIIVVPIDAVDSENVYELPLNTQVFQPKVQKYNLKSLLHAPFWKECFAILFSTKKVNRWLALKTATMSWMRSVQIEEQLTKQLSLQVNWYAYSFWSDDAAIVLSLLQKNKSIVRSVSRAHGFDVYEEVHENPYLPFRTFVYGAIHQVITDSKHGADYLNEKWGGFTLSTCKAMYLGAQNQIRNLHLTLTNRLLLVTCAYVVPVKRLKFIAQALEEITDIQIHWIHIGGGDGLAELKLNCAQFSKNVSVEFVGNKTQEEILHMYSEFEELPLFLNVSSSEGVPVSIMEAFSFGFPALVTHVGGNTEIVDDAKNGFVLPVDFTSEQLIEKLHEFYSFSETEKLKFSEEAFQKQRLFFDQEENAKKTQMLILPSID